MTRSGSDFPQEVPLGELLRRLAERGTALGEARIRAARTELARDLESQLRRLGVVVAATLMLLFGLQFLVVAAFLALAARFGGLLASLLISVPFLIAGATILLVVRSRAGAPFLEKTREAFLEDLRWLTALAR